MIVDVLPELTADVEGCCGVGHKFTFLNHGLKAQLVLEHCVLSLGFCRQLPKHPDIIYPSPTH